MVMTCLSRGGLFIKRNQGLRVAILIELGYSFKQSSIMGFAEAKVCQAFVNANNFGSDFEFSALVQINFINCEVVIHCLLESATK